MIWEEIDILSESLLHSHFHGDPIQIPIPNSLSGFLSGNPSEEDEPMEEISGYLADLLLTMLLVMRQVMEEPMSRSLLRKIVKRNKVGSNCTCLLFARAHTQRERYRHTRSHTIYTRMCSHFLNHHFTCQHGRGVADVTKYLPQIFLKLLRLPIDPVRTLAIDLVRLSAPVFKEVFMSG